VTPLDRYLQRRRIAMARRWIHPGSTVLDVGCADGAFFRENRDHVPAGVGIEVEDPGDWVGEPYELRVGTFPAAVQPGERFDAVVMLAVVEHVPATDLGAWAAAVLDVLEPGGRLVVTVPSPAVDRILDAGIRLRLLHGMDAEHHHGFHPDDVPGVFGSPALALHRRQRFQVGLNNLFVFERR
jgi:SAM-dependent methyltransferase